MPMGMIFLDGYLENKSKQTLYLHSQLPEWRNWETRPDKIGIQAIELRFSSKTENK